MLSDYKLLNYGILLNIKFSNSSSRFFYHFFMYCFVIIYFLYITINIFLNIYNLYFYISYEYYLNYNN